MSDPLVAFVGAGNMASALAGGMLATGWSPLQLTAADPLKASRQRLDKIGVRTHASNKAAIGEADVIVLAVKPQVLKSACTEIAPVVEKRRPVVVSIAAGIETKSLRAWLGSQAPIVRCMPNTPALVRLGASVLYATETVSAQQRELAGSILATVGIIAWVEDEALLHAVTAVSGSGPAYFFLLIEAIRDAGVELGLPADLSRSLAIQTALGAATMASESDLDITELRRQVTSPGGTTEQAIASFEHNRFRLTVSEALAACASRSKQLARELGGP